MILKFIVQIHDHTCPTGAPRSKVMYVCNMCVQVGDLKALPLPMACTLTQFQDGNRYHFAIRAMDVYERSGRFSDPAFIYLNKMM